MPDPPSNRTRSVAIVGLGTVGTGVARVLLDQPERIARRAGRPVRLRHAVVRDLKKVARHRTAAGHSHRRRRSVSFAIRRSQVAVHLVGGIHPAREIMLDLLEAGKDVVTANKALLCEHGDELFATRARPRAHDRLRGRRRRRNPDHRHRRPVPGRQPDHVDRGDPQRHEQLHSHADDPRELALSPGAEARPGAGLRRRRPDARHRRHRRRAEAGDPHATGVRRESAAGGLSPQGNRHARAFGSAIRRRAGLHRQAAGRGAARRRASSKCTCSRRSCAITRRWRRFTARSTRSPSWATSSARPGTRARAPGRCRPPRRSSPI